MKNKKLLITLLLPLMIGVASCSVEGGNSTSSKNSNISSSSSSTVSSQITSSSIKQSSENNVSNSLPNDALMFVNAVNNIVLNEESGKYINEAYGLYENLENWDYPEVLEAFNKLGILEDLYLDYLKLNNAAIAFIDRVDSLPYYFKLTDERSIVLAEEAYNKLSDEQKAMLGVSQAYERLLDARSDFDAMYAQIIEDNKKAAAKEFTDLVDLLPDVSLITLANEEAITKALAGYEKLSDEVKTMDVVVSAYETLQAAYERYNELVENPWINDEIVSASFISAVNNLPEVDDMTMDDRNAIFSAYNLYKTLPASAKDTYDVLVGHNKVQNLIDKYYDLYLESVGEERDDTTPDNVTIINTVDDLLAVENNLSGSYKLGNDIDLSGIEWEALGEKNSKLFTGTLDGAGYTIYNMSNSDCPDARFGIFAHIGARGVVKNLALEGTVEEAGVWAGSICVDNDGTISNCLINLNIKSPKGGHIGGIACNNNMGATVENCIVLSKINGGNWDGGLFVGQYGTVVNSYALTANVSNGQIVGNDASKNTECSKTELQLKQASTYANFDKSIWCIVDGYFPMLIN